MSNHFITTPVAGRTCPRCHTLILTGVAEGLGARVDLTPLNPLGELHVLLAKRITYTLTRSGLVERHAGRIAGGHLRGPVLAAHRCGAEIPAEHQAPPGPARCADTDQPPY
jgi:hypothetical protein